MPLWLLWTLFWTALADPGSEIALVLDNSCSMVVSTTSSLDGATFPPNDPERAAVLGALVVEGLTRGTNDKLTVLGFGSGPGAPPQVVRTAAEIRALPYVSGTYFAPSLREAAATLSRSSQDTRLLMFFTDGIPEDVPNPADARTLAGLDANPALDSVVIGLYGSDEIRDSAKAYLTPLVRHPDDLTLLSNPADVVPAFTRGYARALGSKPLSFTLDGGDSKTIEVGRWVTEVMVVVASSRPGPAFTASLTGPQGGVSPKATGDNGCPQSIVLSNAPNVCADPRRHYAVFRAAHDPNRPATYTLSLAQSDDEAQVGVILRYDLIAALDLPPKSEVGATVPVRARLLFQGRTFDDAEFFTSDGFAVQLKVEGAEIPLTHVGGGEFTGSWAPSQPGLGQPTLAQVVFSNQWLEKRAQRGTLVDGFLDLILRPSPNPLDLGAWQAERGEVRRCGVLDLTASQNADRVAILCEGLNAPAGVTVSCLPVAGSEATLKDGQRGQPQRYEVCVTSAKCCGDASGQGAAVRLVGAHPHYASGAVTVPVGFQVKAAGLLRCWWVELAVGLGLLTLAFVLLGLLRPHKFDPALIVRVASKEADLRRVPSLVIEEQPGGKRGFYRNARLCIDGEGNMIRNHRKAVLVLEAGPGGSTVFRSSGALEVKDRRTSRFEALSAEALSQGHMSGVIYRAGGLFIKFG